MLVCPLHHQTGLIQMSDGAAFLYRDKVGLIVALYPMQSGTVMWAKRALGVYLKSVILHQQTLLHDSPLDQSWTRVGPRSDAS